MLDSLFAIWAVCWMIVMIPSYPWTNSPQGSTPYGYSLFKTVTLLVGIILIIIIVLSEHHLLIR